MRNPPPACVVDASVLIDLDDGGLLPSLRHLPFRLIVPDVVAEEYEQPGSQDLRACGFAVEELSASDVAEIEALAGQHSRALSLMDLSVLVLAKRLDALLLTGEKPLRQAASQHKVRVHGTLWVLDEMVNRRLVSPSRATEALGRMLAAGSRMPKDECQKRLARWRKE